MYRLKAFGAFPPISNNNPNQVNSLGELSAYSMTFALDRGIFKNSTSPNSLLYTFASFKEISSVETQDVAVPPTISNLVLDLMEKLYTKATAGEWHDETVPVREWMLNNYAGQIQNVVVNPMVTDGNRWLPSSVIFEGTSTTNPYSVQIWFSDNNFRSEYDSYVIKVVPPIDNIDRFFDSASVVQAIKDNEITLSDQMTRLGVIADSQPYTLAVTNDFDWVDPTNEQRRILFPWTVAVYGEAGLNIDSIRKALSDWILDNSEYDEDQWQKLFPDIFGSTEFVFTPFWAHIAMPDDAVNQGIGSPVNNLGAAMKMAKGLIRGNGYTDAYIEDNLSVMSTVYKSYQAGVIGGYRNRDGVNQFGDRWKDYISVATSSIDFRRMDESTQKLITTLLTMFNIAETMTAQSAIPRGYMRLIRDDILYVTCTFERTSLIVASRQSTIEKFPVHQGIKKDPESAPE